MANLRSDAGQVSGTPYPSQSRGRLISDIGYWTEVFGTSNRLVYMLGYPTLGEREKSRAAFQADPDWQQARAASEQHGPLVVKVESCILRPTAFSPKG
jgi:hypothetical protein